MTKNYFLFSAVLVSMVISATADSSVSPGTGNSSWCGAFVRGFFGTFKGAPHAFARMINGLRDNEVIEGPLLAFDDKVEEIPKTVFLTKSIEKSVQPREVFGWKVPEELFGYKVPDLVSKAAGPEFVVQCELVDPAEAKRRDVPVFQGEYIDPVTDKLTTGWGIDKVACREERAALIKSQASFRGRVNALGVSFKRWITGQDARVGERDATGVGRILAIYTTVGAIIGVSYLLKKHFFDGDKKAQKNGSAVTQKGAVA